MDHIQGPHWFFQLSTTFVLHLPLSSSGSWNKTAFQIPWNPANLFSSPRAWSLQSQSTVPPTPTHPCCLERCHPDLGRPRRPSDPSAVSLDPGSEQLGRHCGDLEKGLGHRLKPRSPEIFPENQITGGIKTNNGLFHFSNAHLAICRTSHN